MERTYKITKFVSKINHLLNLPWREGNKLISASKLINFIKQKQIYYGKGIIFIAGFAWFRKINYGKIIRW